MASRWETDYINLKGGLILDLPLIQQGLEQKGSANFLRNLEPSLSGGYSRVKGFTKFSDTEVPDASGPSTTIKGVDILRDGTVVVNRNAEIYTGTGATWTKRTSTSLSSESVKMRGARYRFTGVEKTMYVDGANDPYSINHSDKSFTQLSSPPTEVSGAEYVEEFAQRIWFAKGNFLSYTAPTTDNDFNTGNGAGVINVGSAIVGIKAFKGDLFIFCSDQIKRITGTSSANFTLLDFVKSVGCVSGDTIQEVGSDVFYLSYDGIRTISDTDRSGSFQIQKSTRKINLAIQNNILNLSEFSSCKISLKNQYRIFGYSAAKQSFASQGLIATIFDNVVNSDSVEWSELYGIKSFSASNIITESGAEVVVFSNDDNYVYLLESGNTFDGENITWVYWTPYYSFNDPVLRKTIYKITLYGSFVGGLTANLDIRKNVNNPNFIFPATDSLDISSGETSTYGVSVYNSSLYSREGVNFAEKTVSGTGYNFSLRFSGTHNTNPFSIKGLAIEYSTQGRQ